jgi:hypothetical protein
MPYWLWGAALFELFAVLTSAKAGVDSTRIAAYVVSGVGFLGAGVILRDRKQVGCQPRHLSKAGETACSVRTPRRNRAAVAGLCQHASA